MLHRSVTPLVYTLSASLQTANDDLVYASKRRVYFNLLLADYLMLHLPLLWLDDIAVKHINNTWFLMSESQDDVEGMCCLAAILTERFDAKLASATGISAEKLPGLSTSITASRGRRIKLADGRYEWVTKDTVGVDKTGGIKERDFLGKVVIDEKVRVAVDGKFLTEIIEDRVDKSSTKFINTAKKGFNETIPGEINGKLYTISGMNNDTFKNMYRGSERLIYTARFMDAAGMFEKISTTELQDASLKMFADLCFDMVGVEKETGQDFAKRFNSLIAGVNDYEFSVNLIKDLPDSRSLPDAATYSLLMDQARDFSEIRALTGQMAQNEIRLNSKVLTGVIAKSPDFATAVSWLDFAEQSEITVECDAYNRCIVKAPDSATANALYDDMLAHNVSPDIATYAGLISKSHDIEQAKAWLKILLDEDLLPNLFVFNRVIAKCTDYVAALEVFNEISVIGINPNAITFNTLVSRAPDYEVARTWVDTMNKRGVQPNVDTFVRLFSKDLGIVKASELLDLYLIWGLPSEEPIQTAISTYQKNGRIDQALYLAVDYPHLPSASKLLREIMRDVMAYLDEVKDDKTTVSLESYKNLIENAPFYDTALSWFEAMKKNGINPDAGTYSEFVKKALDFETGKYWINTMVESGFDPGDDVYSVLFSKNLANVTADDLVAWFKNQPRYSDDPVAVAMRTYKRTGLTKDALRVALEFPQLEESRKIISEHVNLLFSYMKAVCEESALVDVDAYGGLISKAPYYDVAESWLDIMKSKGVKPDIAIYNTLLAKAPNYETATVLLKAIIEDRVEPNIVTFGTLIAKSPNYETAKQWFKAMRKSDIKPNVVIYSSLLSKTSDYSMSRALLDEMRAGGVKPNVISFNAAIHNAPDYLAAKDLIDEMFKQKVKPNIVTFNRLFCKNLSGIRAHNLIEWYNNLKYHPAEPMQAAISTYRKMGLIKDARYLAVRYPGLAISKKVVAEKVATEDIGSVNDSDVAVGVPGDGPGSSENGSSEIFSVDTGLENSREFIENAKNSNMMKQCLRIMESEISSSVGI